MSAVMAADLTEPVQDSGVTETTVTPPARTKLVAQGLAKRYGTTDALKPTDLDVVAGELLTVLGPSGSGKTTLLQLVCGLVEPTAGRLFIDGVDETDTPIHKRDIGVVFQSYALFPHLTVEENVAFPLQMRRLDGPERRKRVNDALEIVGLGPLARRFPRELSGGQQQRVALARCFVYRPAIILMDEPLGALDRKLRETMQIEIKRLHRETGATIVFVTHDQEEALALSDRICLMNHAAIEQVGTPREVYERPRTTFAADFIGVSNIFTGRIDPAGRLETADGPMPMPRACAAGPAAGGRGNLMVRPEHVAIEPGSRGPLTGHVIETVYSGAETRLLIALRSGTVVVGRRSAADPDLPLGGAVSLSWPAERAHFIAA